LEELERANLFVSALDFLGSLVAGVLLGDLATKRGQLHAAAEHYKAAIRAVGQRGSCERWQAAVQLGDLARERNDWPRPRTYCGRP
jgi:hypothetical protein